MCRRRPRCGLRATSPPAFCMGLRSLRGKPKWLLGGTALAALPAVYLSQSDDKTLKKLGLFGLQRSAVFWSEALPIWLHYRVTQWRVGHLPEAEQDKAYEPLHNTYAQPALDIILKLKGFYVKIGQMAATRADFLPAQYYDRVKTLQSETPAEPFEYIRGLVESSLGKPLASVFQSVDENPLGAASIGQAHRATLLDGRSSVVKVMFPNVEEIFRSDIKTMKDFCALAQPEHLVMLDEVEKQFLTEFDFTKEAENLSLIRSNMLRAWPKEVVVPEPFLSTRSVLVMEYVPGAKLVDALTEHFETVAMEKGMTVQQLREEMEEREERGETIAGPTAQEMRRYQAIVQAKTSIANTKAWGYNTFVRPLVGGQRREYREARLPLNTAAIIDLLFRVHGHQVFADGAFNGDPHPGNILLTPDGRLGLIDYGQVKHISLEDRLKLANLVVALAEDDRAAVVRAYTDMGFRTEKMDPHVIYEHAKAVYDNDHRDTLGGKNIQLFLEELQAKDPVKVMPDEYIMVGRVAALLRGLAYALKYKPSVAKLWEPQARALLAKHEKRGRE